MSGAQPRQQAQPQPPQAQPQAGPQPPAQPPGPQPPPAGPPQPHHPPRAYPSPQSDDVQSGGHAGTGGVAAAGVGTGATLGSGAGAADARRLARTGARTVPRTRKARLRVSKADPWSVMKVSFLLSIALGVCTVVAVAVLWMVMDAMGVFAALGDTISEATSSDDGGGFDLQQFLSLPRVLLFTSIVALIDVVLATALATLGAFIYNLSAGFVGGVEVTLAEDE
ncbi:DUF3566 domain-containing protein [Streptomyces armeniacus]|uniref:DUF3566 domain-containing protein n=1 Tax=Streptomyces armeniacus TaxID=83291 RepID=A0A345XPC3_9ACTN|nr:DUF3566 domain-containing protein [Streptomyces armeniacus]AXK33489.1 DUF3566 domain-containing protein [Streptomyces armeniacus]